MPGVEEEAHWARRWLFDSAFPVWAGAGRGAVGFVDRLNAEARPAGGAMRLRVQARQLYVFATAGRLGWGGPWRDAVEHGARFLLERGPSADGRLHSRYDEEGAPLPGRFDLYDQAFALFGFAHAYRALGSEPCRGAALRLLETLKEKLGRDDGGFEEDSPVRLPLRSNPHMHLFEAALAWVEADDRPEWRALAGGLDRLARARFIEPQHGRVLEFFDAGFAAAPGEEGRITEPGHQFEWAWLLDWNARLGGTADLNAADRMARQACDTGVDRVRGVAFNEQWIDGAPKDTRARLWPQTEWLKAAIAGARRTSGQERAFWTGEIVSAVKGLRLYLDIPAPGLWRDLMLDDGTLVEEAAPGSSGYHIVCALAELIDYAG